MCVRGPCVHVCVLRGLVCVYTCECVCVCVLRWTHTLMFGCISTRVPITHVYQILYTFHTPHTTYYTHELMCVYAWVNIKPLIPPLPPVYCISVIQFTLTVISNSNALFGGFHYFFVLVHKQISNQSLYSQLTLGY